MGITIDRAFVFRALALAAMFGCLVLGLEQLLERGSLSGGSGYPWRTGDLACLCAAAALLAQCSYELATRRALERRHVLLLGAGQLALLLVAVKLLESHRLGRGPLTWWAGTPLNALTMGNIVAMLLAGWAWVVSGWLARDLNSLDLDPGSDFAPESPADRLFKSFYVGGVLLFLMTGMARLKLSELLSQQHPPVPGLIANVLVYFLLGLAMLGQVRLARLRHLWSRQSVSIDRGLNRRWALYSVQFLGLAALAALLVSSIWSGWPFGELEIAVSGGPRRPSPAAGLPTIYLPLTAYEPLYGARAVHLGEYAIPAAIMAGGCLVGLWLLVLLRHVAGAALELPVLGPALQAARRVALAIGRVLGWAARRLERVVPGLRALRLVLEALLRRGRRRALLKLQQALAAALPDAPSAPRRLPRRLGSAPRDRVIAYYLSLLQRAEKSGLPRRQSETPDEYRATLEPVVGGAEEDLAELTRTFLEARYSRLPIDQPDVERTRSRLRRLTLAMRSGRDKASS